ncbi:MAG: NHL repeat-containing protein [Oscillochloridaceae bacterium]|nr:NHL repeat-containing protein [Chloroflexaceae bacterium]MDW8390788.1 NHL repeat-containing protein [Oscillochloridaceae bacterium]
MANWTPSLRLGAESPGGLALPAARPTPAQLYAPRGVYLDDERLVVADTGNHRVLIWRGLPDHNGAPADVVLGQPDFTSEGPAAGGRGPANGMHLPTGVLVVAGRLYVADAWHHRVLVWERVPERLAEPPDYALGQTGLNAVEPNRGGAPDALSLYWPYGLGWSAGWFYVADTGNRRVLGWRGLPEPGRAPDLILGQPMPTAHDENRGGPPGPASFRWPHAIAGDATTLYVADAGNHRVLGWSPPPEADRPADLVLGQPDFASSSELAHVPQGPRRLRFPYALALEGQRLAVADTANNRVLLWNHAPRRGAFAPADVVLGQANFDDHGENRWRAVASDTLCWPYGLWLHHRRLAIADSGNNRVMIWTLDGPGKGGG